MRNAWIAYRHNKIGERLPDADDVGDYDEVDVGGIVIDEFNEKEGEDCKDDEGWQEAEIWVKLFLQSGPKVIVR